MPKVKGVTPQRKALRYRTRRLAIARNPKSIDRMMVAQRVTFSNPLRVWYTSPPPPPPPKAPPIPLELSCKRTSTIRAIETTSCAIARNVCIDYTNIANQARIYKSFVKFVYSSTFVYSRSLFI